MKLATTWSISISCTPCNCSKFKSLSRCSLVVVSFFFILLTPEAAVSASVDPIGEIQPITNSYLILGNKNEDCHLMDLSGIVVSHLLVLLALNLLDNRKISFLISDCTSFFVLAAAVSSQFLLRLAISCSHILYHLFNPCLKCNLSSNFLKFC